MKYNETNYHGTKKELESYLHGLYFDAITACTKEFKPAKEKALEEFLEKFSYKEWLNTYGKVISEGFKELEKIMDEINEYYKNDSRTIMYPIDNLRRYAEGTSSIDDHVRGKIQALRIEEYQAIDYELTQKISLIKQEWTKVFEGIVDAKKRKVKYICRDLEEAGIDLTPYYEKQIAIHAKQANLPTPSIDLNILMNKKVNTND
jgi:hypothetical protein|nr:MAG TPA: hypothetical protein [Caudoviricetes sp.]